MFRHLLVLIALLNISCSAYRPFTWQDTRLPVRDSADADIEKCRLYAAAQYKPGMPSGESYLEEQETPHDPLIQVNAGEWRPDRDPLQQTNTRSTPIHDIPVDYTGYPGELDYYPDYLSDIFEKCMNDKGWEYKVKPE